MYEMSRWHRELQHMHLQKELWAALEKDHIAPFLHRYEKFLIEGGKTFFVSDHVSHAV